VDALYILGVRSEISGMIDLIFKQNSRYFVANEVGRLDGIVGGVEKVGLQRTSSDGKLQISASLHVCISDGPAPHLDSIGMHGIFRRGFFVLSVKGFIQTMRPTMTMIPIEHPADGEVVICGAWIGNISNESVDKIFVGCEPIWIKIAYYSCCVDKISIVKVMIVVVGVTEVGSRVARCVRGRGNKASPSGFINERILLVVGGKQRECRLETGKSGLCQGKLLHNIV